MSKYIVLFCVSFLVSCGEAGRAVTNNDNSSQVNTTKLLTWIGPTRLVTGALIEPTTDLLEYKIYYGESAENVKANVHSVEPSVTSLEIASLSGLNTTLVFVAVSAVTTDGIESALSSVISFTP
ncbi:MAG: hypothetical protein ISR69_13485 [Gammaproteobacteria bacterium]|nr:hypothetical protein [Gammaproteobacteria bacterium]